ncbi:hypothetical protein Y032_0017g3225 [Ancylostoma ceylanicum]|uniref:Uncharacterized protein n=1 Tax=Ancylostoma ceylanicum TaxID=53326 RepID=A0A016V5E5_9BILA|nr:hypothetical protein Y032_0017g3225 [Ancylostoma ceylanicum]
MPVTRSGSKTAAGAAAYLSDPKVDTTASERLASSLENLDDGATVQGRDAKLLRDAAALAIAQETPRPRCRYNAEPTSTRGRRYDRAGEHWTEVLLTPSTRTPSM